MWAAGRPFTTSGFRLSKVPSTPCTSRPPLGASGLTYEAAQEIRRPGRFAVHGDGMAHAGGTQEFGPQRQRGRQRAENDLRRDHCGAVGRGRQGAGRTLADSDSFPDAEQFTTRAVPSLNGLLVALVALSPAEIRLSGTGPASRCSPYLAG